DTVEVTRSGFTATGSPTSESRNVGGAAEATTAWTYDPVGRPVERDVRARTGGTTVTRWSWQDNGALSELTAPSGVTRGYEYDGAGLLDRISNATTGAEIALVTGRNGRGQITDLEQRSDATERTFDYDEAGRIAHRTVGVLHGPASTTWGVSHDWAGRIT